MFGNLAKNFHGLVVRPSKGQLARFASAQKRFQSTDRSGSKTGLVIENKDQLTDTFKKANTDKGIKTIVLTGTGDYYSSGNDLSNFTAAMQHPEGFKMGLKVSGDIRYDFVDSMIRKLSEVNRRECDEIVELWSGEECTDAVQKFFNRAKK